MAQTNESERVLAAWRRHVPDITREEVEALLPLLAGGGTLTRLVRAYRAGRRDAGPRR